MQTDQQRIAEVLRLWLLKPSSEASLVARLKALLDEVRTETYNSGYDDGFSDGMNSEGL